ncbi:MAG TPA: serine protease [Ramlibacter sp.]|uniref:trypsin-like serine peptidase n=1 Tax=Ramlibacter sp. TaxID=1917967 RepID=UPI002D7F62E1|nr:serine protease [Ramlibacter sp.]HET8748483.1 serine protease [Ramlibacter sp.]
MIEPLFFAVVRISTFFAQGALTAASGFFFERDDRLFLVTARHVLLDRPTGHHPDRVEIRFHTDATDLTRGAVLSVPLYMDGRSAWRQATDSGGEIDVAAIEVDRRMVPEGAVVRAFTAAHLQEPLEEIRIGAPVLVVGFPLGFFDTLHNLPVARQAAIASAFGVRFQGQGYFLTDARMHRGGSGAPVVLHDARIDTGFPWKLLGIHSARLDMGNREQDLDESLGLNCAWYADVLTTLTL